MKKECEFSESIRPSEALRAWSRKSAAGRGSGRVAGAPDDPPLIPAQVREIKRRVADLDDPVRYLLASRMAPRFVLYYNLSDDMYALNDPKGATLFKRRKAAESVKRLLGGRVRVIRCATRRRNGQRVPLLPALPRRKRNE
jgi:hypothetical protein